MELGEYITKYRKEAGITLDELALISGVPKGTINKIIAGTTKSPTLENVRSIAIALGKTLNDFSDAPSTTKKAPSVSDEAMKVARRYHQLDAHGRATVRAVLEEEENRLEEEKQLASPASEKEAKVIPLYLSPAAAGYVAPVFGEEYEDYTLKEDDPQGAMFAVKLQGDSMEPQFPDGSIVFCNKDPVQDGDIGIFYVGSGTVCKQFHQRGRIIYLFSLNRKRADADMMVFPESNQTFVCQGRVITRRRFPTPN